ncbi:uncharacterized protein LODBEIA_P20300 [Lodderomyces beijingensis]|uniref:MATE efflux family protein n=1 Tax=Lodderomyces beijingensis TaxID=1775926 RepID=A0ABP0ZL15_9ASCO
MNAEEPLLIGAYRSYETIDQFDEDEQITYSSELQKLIGSSAPLVITFFLQYTFAVTCLYSAGLLGPLELGACSLAICTFNISGLAIFQGMATSLDTFCSQSFGAGNLHGVGVYFQRCSLVMLATMVPMSFFWWNARWVLSIFISDDELTLMAQRFLRIHLIGVPAYIFIESGKRFLQAQHIFSAGTYVLVAAAPFNIFLNWLLVWNGKTSLGFDGIPLCIAITYWAILLAGFGYVVFVDGRQCWGGFTSKAFSKWLAILKLAIPGVIMVVSEYLAFEIMVIFAASFGTEALAAQSIAANLASLVYQPPFAYAVALSTRVGHHIGTKKIKGAKIDTSLFYFSAAVIGLINCSIFVFGRNLLGRLFTDDETVLQTTAGLNVLVGINQIADTFNVLGTGVLRGQGRQKVGSILNSISYYVIAIPLGYTLAFKLGFELKGLWCGLIVAVMFLATTQCFVIASSNWTQILENSDKIHD